LSVILMFVVDCFLSVLIGLHTVISVHSVLEKSLKMLEFGIKPSRPLKVLENIDKVLEST